MRFSRISIAIGVASTFLLSGCGGGTSTNSSESFVAGNGAVTYVKPDARKMAPNISGKTLEGSDYNLANFSKGKVSVVNVWASWCAPCRAEAPALSSLSKTFNMVPFVGILTRDNISTAKSFVKRFAVPYPTLVDDSILIGFRGSLMANAIPSTVIIDRQGRVAARISGEITVGSLTEMIKKVMAE